MSEGLKCIPIQDSNIPLRKKILYEKKPREQRKLPELQKYIEVIVNGNEKSEKSTEDGCPTEMKTSNSKTSSLCGRSENKNKHETYKEVVLVSSRQSGNKTRGKPPGVGGRRIEGTSKKGYRSLENPKSFDRSQLVFSLVGKFLENLYPNPYVVGKKNKSKTPKSRQKSAEGRLKKAPTVVDLLVVSKARSSKNIITPKAKKPLNSGLEIAQNTPKENKAHIARTHPDPGVLSCLFKDKTCNDSIRNDEFVEESVTNKAPVKILIQNNSRHSSSNKCSREAVQSVQRSTCNGKSSREGEEKGSRGHVGCERKPKTEEKSVVQEKAESLMKKLMETEDLNGLSDIDFGKLKLLTSNYLSDAIRRNSEMQRNKKLGSDKCRREPVLLFESSSNSKNLKKTQESTNLWHSQDLKKAREKSVITPTSASEKDLKNAKYKCEYNNESRKLVQYLNEVNISKTLAQRKEDERNFGYPPRGSKSHVVIEEVDNESFHRFSEKKVKREVEKRDAVDLNKDERKSKGKSKKGTRDVETEKCSNSSEKYLEEFEQISVSGDQHKFYETSKKIDDVLQFMYNCLLKFNNEYGSHISHTEVTQSVLSKSSEENPKPELQSEASYSSTASYSLLSVKSMDKICHIQSVPLVKDRHPSGLSDLSPEFGETSKQSKHQSKKRQSISEHISRSYHGIDKNTYQIPTQREGIWADSESPSTLLCESVDVNPQTGVQTVEVQNELGGYSEEALTVVNDDPKLAKAILPHSVKFRNRKNDACEVIKNALETEEKLLAEGKNSKEHIEKEIPRNEILKHGNPLGSLSPEKFLLTSYTPDQVGAYSLIRGVNQQYPCFVIYVNSLPNNLIPMVSSPLSISLNEAKTLDLRNYQLPQSSLKKLRVNLESTHKVSGYAYCVKKEFLRLLNKSIVAQIARVVCLIFISEMARLESEISSENSKCLIDFLFAPKKLMFEEPISCSIFGVSYVFEQKKTNLRSEVLKVTFLSKQRILGNGTRAKIKVEKKTEEKGEEWGKNNEEKPMRYLENAVEETEEKVLLLQQNKEPAGNVHKSACIERLISYNSGSAENEREKVHDLLLRTYSLQNKLHRYLHKMSCLQASSSSCPLLRHETFLDIGVLFKQKTSTEVFPLGAVDGQLGDSHSMVCWPSDTSTIKETKVEKALEKVQIISRCHPVPEGKSQEGVEKKETSNDEDDSPGYRSSDCSFKSSSDLSGGNEIPNEDETSRDCKILGKIFNELEITRRSGPKEEKPTDLNSENKICEFGEKREAELSEQDAKAPAKVLKTLFRGKESLTELSMGLKDFPLSEVSNISVEKKKLSANHTQISICICKGKPEETKKPRQPHESGLQINGDVRSNFSFYDFDNLRPGLSTCRTEYSRLENVSGKSSSDEDEDDFKSVASSFTSSDSEEEEEETPEEKKSALNKVQASSRRTSTKRQFDLYRKMTVPDTKTIPVTSNTICDYKALEPLQQALTEMQIRMKSINKNSFFYTNEYYKKALKLAKMSAGYCQNCGNHSVIPDDTFGFYRNLLPPKYSAYSRDCFFNKTPSSSYYSFRSRNRDLSDHFLDLNLNQSSYNLLNGPPVRLGPF